MAIMRGFAKPKSVPSKAAGKAIGKKVLSKPSKSTTVRGSTSFGNIGTGLAKPGGTVRKMKSTPRKIGNKIDYKKIGSFARPSKPVTRKARPVPVKRRK